MHRGANMRIANDKNTHALLATHLALTLGVCSEYLHICSPNQIIMSIFAFNATSGGNHRTGAHPIRVLYSITCGPDSFRQLIPETSMGLSSRQYIGATAGPACPVPDAVNLWRNRSSGWTMVFCTWSSSYL
jgi:hypothetical protein